MASLNRLLTTFSPNQAAQWAATRVEEFDKEPGEDPAEEARLVKLYCSAAGSRLRGGEAATEFLYTAFNVVRIEGQRRLGDPVGSGWMHLLIDDSARWDLAPESLALLGSIRSGRTIDGQAWDPPFEFPHCFMSAAETRELAAALKSTGGLEAYDQEYRRYLVAHRKGLVARSKDEELRGDLPKWVRGSLLPLLERPLPEGSCFCWLWC